MTSYRTPSLSRSRRIPDTEKLLLNEVESRKQLELQLDSCFDELKQLKSNNNYQELTIEQMKMNNTASKRQFDVQIEILSTATTEKEEIIRELEVENEENYIQLERIQVTIKQNVKEINQQESYIKNMKFQEQNDKKDIEKAERDIERLQREIEKASEQFVEEFSKRQVTGQQLEDIKREHFEKENSLIEIISKQDRRRKVAKLIEFAVILFCSFNLCLQIFQFLK
ncbi:hypothetical protein SS50377_27455 [Spironucleus salmonicida]|nr:hypothetical protein SS50377_27455 [Spironucleus salmonicida]